MTQSRNACGANVQQVERKNVASNFISSHQKRFAFHAFITAFLINQQPPQHPMQSLIFAKKLVNLELPNHWQAPHNQPRLQQSVRVRHKMLLTLCNEDVDGNDEAKPKDAVGEEQSAALSFHFFQIGFSKLHYANFTILRLFRRLVETQSSFVFHLQLTFSRKNARFACALRRNLLYFSHCTLLS